MSDKRAAQEFLALFLPVQGSLMALILSRGVASQDADDLLQETAAVLLDRFDHFERGTNFRAWAYAVARNKILSHFKQQARHGRRHQRLQPDEQTACELDELVERESEGLQLVALRHCVDRLGDRARELVSMHYEQRKAAADIAQERQLSLQSVRTLLSRIRRKLKHCIEHRLKAAGEPA